MVHAPPIHAAIHSGNLHEVNEWIKNDPVSVTSCDDNGNTTLHAAAYKGNTQIIGVLLEAYVPPVSPPPGFTAKHCFLNQRNPFGNTPLHTAVHYAKVTAAQILIENGANLDALNIRGHTPLGLADEMQNGELESAKRSNLQQISGFLRYAHDMRDDMCQQSAPSASQAGRVVRESMGSVERYTWVPDSPPGPRTWAEQWATVPKGSGRFA